MFEVQELHAFYGASHIVQGVSLSVGKGEAVALMGRNGVGKTTTLKSIAGMVAKTLGHVLLDGEQMDRLRTHTRAGRGLGYVPEDQAIFPSMTVEENVRIGAMACAPARQRECLDQVFELFPILAERRGLLAGALSGGQQKMLALARGLALQPKLLLVDEPSEGLMPINVELITAALVKATSQGVAVLVVDSSFDLVKEVCARMYAMDRGVLTGMYVPSDFASADALAATYVGRGEA